MQNIPGGVMSNIYFVWRSLLQAAVLFLRFSARRREAVGPEHRYKMNARSIVSCCYSSTTWQMHVCTLLKLNVKASLPTLEDISDWDLVSQLSYVVWSLRRDYHRAKRESQSPKPFLPSPPTIAKSSQSTEKV